MQIHIARKSAPLGVYSQAEVTEGLKNGQFLLTDLAWREGMSTWAPLSQWAEFSSAIPPSPSIPFISGSNDESTTVPWEKKKSISSFWATIKGAIISPQRTLAVGRFKFSDYIPFCYIGVLFYFPFAVYGQWQSAHLNEQMAEYLRALNNPAFDSLIHGLMQSAEQPAYYGILGVLCATMVYPFIMTVGGFFQWLGLKILRQKVTIEQSIVSSIVGVTLANLCFAPLVLFMGVAWLYILLAALLFIPIFILHCRASAAVLKISPLTLFFSWLILGFIFCSCCCCLGAMAAFAVR